MRYERPQKQERQENRFTKGTHPATIDKVVKKPSEKGNKMFILQLVGNEGQTGAFFLTFDTPYTDENLAYLLASIEDNGVDIPDIEFGHNRETFEFLKGKEVYIEVEIQPYNGENRPAVKTFLTLDDFEKSEDDVSEDTFDDEWD